MSYTIKRTDGTPLVEIPDQTIDNATLGRISLVGRGAVNYGTAFAENFVYLLENFSAPTPPYNPLQGQLWYDTSTRELKVFDAVKWTALSYGEGTASNLPNTLVLRDSRGNFSAGTISATLDGTATRAIKLATPRAIVVSGAVEGTTLFDGSQDILLATRYSESGVNAGRYGNASTVPQITVAETGVISHAANVAIAITSNAITDATELATPFTVMQRNRNADVYANAFHGLLKGTADDAKALTEARTITLGGDLTGNVAFDGSKNVTIDAQIANSGIVAGVYNWNEIKQFRIGSDGRWTAIAPGTPDNLSVEHSEVSDHATTATTATRATTADTATTATRATTADKLVRSMTLNLIGQVVGSVAFDGSKNVTMSTTVAALPTTGVTAGTYTNATVRVAADGRITAISNGLANNDGDSTSTADYATRAGAADTAKTADKALVADRATIANTANSAGSADTADFATRATTANTALAYTGNVTLGQLPRLLRSHRTYVGRTITNSSASFNADAAVWQEANTMAWDSSAGSYRVLYISAGSGTVYPGSLIMFRVTRDSTLLWEDNGGTPYNTYGLVLNPGIYPMLDFSTTGGRMNYKVEVALFGRYSNYEVVTQIQIMEFAR